MAVVKILEGAHTGELATETTSETYHVWKTRTTCD